MLDKVGKPSSLWLFVCAISSGKNSQWFGWGPVHFCAFMWSIKHCCYQKKSAISLLPPVTANAEGLPFSRLWFGTVHSDDSVGEENIIVYFCLLSKRENSSMLRKMRKVVTEAETTGNLEAGLWSQTTCRRYQKCCYFLWRNTYHCPI